MTTDNLVERCEGCGEDIDNDNPPCSLSDAACYQCCIHQSYSR